MDRNGLKLTKMDHNGTKTDRNGPKWTETGPKWGRNVYILYIVVNISIDLLDVINIHEQEGECYFGRAPAQLLIFFVRNKQWHILGEGAHSGRGRRRSHCGTFFTYKFVGNIYSCVFLHVFRSNFKIAPPLDGRLDPPLVINLCWRRAGSQVRQLRCIYT